MNRPPRQPGRLATFIGGSIVLVGCFLPWYRVGGASGLPALSANAFDGAGIVVFVAGVALLALVLLPIAAGDLPLSFDRPASFVLVAGVAVVGWLARAWQLWQLAVLGLPDRAPGFWLAALGIIVAVVGTARIATGSSEG